MQYLWDMSQRHSVFYLKLNVLKSLKNPSKILVVYSECSAHSNIDICSSDTDCIHCVENLKGCSISTVVFD